jgi:hypothetical protein
MQRITEAHVSKSLYSNGNSIFFTVSGNITKYHIQGQFFLFKRMFFAYNKQNIETKVQSNFSK